MMHLEWPRGGERPQSTGSSQCRRHWVSFLRKDIKSALYQFPSVSVWCWGRFSSQPNHKLGGHEVDRWGSPLFVCVCVTVCMSRLLCLQVITSRSQESTRHHACRFPPLPWHWYTCRPFFQRHPSPFSNIKVFFERAIRTEGDPFMWSAEHGRGCT